MIEVEYTLGAKITKEVIGCIGCWVVFVFTEATTNKHINIQFHVIREGVANKHIAIVYVFIVGKLLIF
jgi:hypothetical protein